MSDVWLSLYVLELFTVSFCASVQSECEAFNSLVDRYLWQAVLDHLQRFFECGDWLGVWIELVIGLQHRAPDMGRNVQSNLEATGRFWWIPAVDLRPFLCDACLSLIAVVKVTQLQRQIHLVTASVSSLLGLVTSDIMLTPLYCRA